LVNLADRLRLRAADPASPDRMGQMVAALADYLGKHPDTLLIFDNVVDPRHLQTVQVAAGITPVKLGGILLFTTRRREMPTGLAALDVNVLPHDSSRQMILAARPEAIADPDLDRLCATLGDLPLALKLAAAALRRRTRLSLAAYLDNLQRLGADVVHDTARVTLDDYYAASLTPALQEQWAALEDENARLLLCVAGQLGEAELIPVARLGLLASLCDDEDGLIEPLSDALRELQAICLIEKLAGDQVRLHPLVREFATNQTAKAETPDFRARCAANLAAAYEDVAVLEDHCARRGIDALQGDLLTALNLLLAEPGAPGEEPGTEVRNLLRLVQREAHNLRDWEPGQRPSFFAQQVHYRAASLEFVHLAADAAAYLAEQAIPFLQWQWGAIWESPALERTLTGHEDGVRAVALTPDGRRAVSPSDRTLRVWDLATGEALATLRGHEGEVWGVALTPDGRRAVSASADRMLKVWDLASGEEVATLRGHEDCVLGVALTPDGRRAVSASDDRTLRVWDLATGEEVSTLRGHEDEVLAVALTPDGRRAVSASEDQTLKVWDLATGEEVSTLRAHEFDVQAVALTPDGRRAVSPSDRTLRVWDLATGEALATLRGHESWVLAVALTPDGRRAVSADVDGTLRVWNLTSKEELTSVRGHEDTVVAVTVSSDGKWAVSSSHDEALKIWDTATGEAVLTAAWSSEGRWMTSLDETSNAWDPASIEASRALQKHRSLVFSRDPLVGRAVTPDGECYVSARAEGTLYIWGFAGKEPFTIQHGHKGKVTSVALTPDGRRAMSTSVDRTLKIWDLSSGKELATLALETRLESSFIGPDGVAIVVGDGAGNVYCLRYVEPPAKRTSRRGLSEGENTSG
jgi:WD40 repeat protein